MIKHKIRSISTFTGLVAVVLGNSISMTSGSAYADLPGKHPYYLHALTDLRTARWLLEHRSGDAAVSGQEDVAIQQIDYTINDIKKASIDDGKDIHNHPNIDVPNNHPGRLHKVEEILNKVHSDVRREEDDRVARGLQHRSLQHIDAALKATKRAVYDIEHHR
ncbi:hypothetical protein [Nostoc sp.]|uniref:hypothetical protein n=2 Tax=Nostoc TaxID=1177 RepID=UPI000B95AFE7|nr:hypothetical protein CDG79_02965 [Nostoc sp. 'Peltigera membranacea cyanobiont' 232]